MPVTEISSQTQFLELTGSAAPEALVAVYFHTPWAAPCIQMNTVVATLAEAHPAVTFLLVNADDHPEILEVFDVLAVPYFVLVRGGTIVKEVLAADPKAFVQALTEATAGAGAAAAAPEAAAVPAAESKAELTERLQKLTLAAPVMLFMKGTPAAPQCGFSRQLVAILREHQVRFGFFDILKDDAVRQGLKEFSDWPTFPQLYINGEFQGGLDIVKESLEEDSGFFALVGA